MMLYMYSSDAQQIIWYKHTTYGTMLYMHDNDNYVHVLSCCTTVPVYITWYMYATTRNLSHVNVS